ncbi:MAG: hypothetical protein IMW89_16915, partial [Ktedonobacteraceae bacterium]|nr:hypothetical protein [Ktedonobacteraceae bacterium]
MEDKQSEAIRAIVTYCIESAALQPEKRFELLLKALEALRRAIPVLGTALIWPCRERKIPWKVLYSGPNSQSMYRWLSARLRVSLDETINLLQHDCATLSDMPTPLFIRLQLPDLLQSGQSGGWMVWPSDLLSSGSLMQAIEHTRYYLESLLEVEYKESLYFPGTFQPLDPQLIEALI